MVTLTQRFFVTNNNLTKRELFAAMTLQGMLACPNYYDWELKLVARAARLVADELIDELNQSGGK